MYNIIILGMMVMFPTYAFAAGGYFDQIVSFVGKFITALFPILVAFAGVVFMFQVIRFITTTKEDTRTGLRTSIGVNLIVLFVLLGFWGIIAMLSNMLGLTLGTDIAVTGKASTACTLENIRGIFMCISGFISKKIIPLFVSIAAALFMFNIIRYMYSTESETERTKLRGYVLWSLLALGIMLTIFAILNIGTQTFFGSSSFIPQFSTGK